MKTGRTISSSSSSRTRSNAVNNKKAASALCLFCASSWRTEEPGQRGHHGHHHQILFTESGKDDGNLIQGHLRAIFVLRQVLRLSVDQVADYLSRNDGSLNPGGWFSVCSSCDAAVRECFTLQRRLVQLERKLEGVKLRLVNLIYSTGAKQRSIKRRRECLQNLTFDIRETVLNDLSVTQQTQYTGAGATKGKMSPAEGSGRAQSTLRKVAKGTGRRRKRSGAKTLLGHHGRKAKSSGNRGIGRRKCQKVRGSRQNDNNKKAATATITNRVSKIPSEDEEHDEHDQSTELETPEESTIPESYDDSEASSAEPKFVEDDGEPSCELDSLSPCSNNINEDSGSDWSPSEEEEDDDDGEHDSDREDNRSSSPPKTKMRSCDSHHEEQHKSVIKPEEKEEMSSSGPATTSVGSQPANNNTGGDLPSHYRYYTHRCHHCPAAYRTQVPLAIHLKLHAKWKRRAGVVDCDKCGWRLSAHRLQQHALYFCRFKASRPKWTTDGIPYYCDHCHMIFPQKFRLLRHCSNYHADKKSCSPRCQHCGAQFVSRQLLRMHVEACHHHNSSEDGGQEDDGTTPPPAVVEEDCKPSPCPHCPETFDSKLKLDFHIALLHRDCLLTCPICQLKIDRFPSYVAHLRDHKRQELQRAKKESKHEGIPFYCDHCHMIFTHEVYIVKHVRRFHSAAQQSASCPHCDSDFVSKQLLRMHVEMVHPAHELQDGDGTLLPPHAEDDSEPKSCPHCPETLTTFPSKTRLDFHIAKVHRDALLTCPTCQYKAQSYQAFHHHSRSHQRRTVRYGKPNYQPNKPPLAANPEDLPRRVCYSYRCPHCPASYATKARFSIHLKLHDNHDEGGVHCDKCQWLVPKAELEHHLKRSCTSRRRRWRRQNEPKVTKRFSYEVRTLTEGIPYYCDHCHMIYTKTNGLLRHHELHHPGAELRVCQTCGSNFVSQQLLQMHTEANHPAEEITDKGGPPPPVPAEPPQDCPHCPQTFPSKMNLDYHVASLHRATLLSCKQCPYKTDTYSEFVTHSRTHQKRHEVVKQYSCHVCGVQLTTQQSLNGHLQSFHAVELGLEEIICHICGVNVASEGTLRMHIRNVHEKKKEHCCEFCGKAFCTRSDLKKHLLLHTAPRELQYKKGPFPCQYCDSKFNVRQGLYYHLKRDHSDKYRFRCEQCGKGYCSKAFLTRHQRECCKQ